ncbi:hypothetical protein STA1M1_37520 [Sinisalibacter aestuarii]|uniref:4-hydroxy-tetrahydrodipicolinate synthase n=1 Tax=Sinisalibacter aestuarii TaxID=2949426 RepID=A0ABQ5LZ23_9RHOB|nr:hypothetical protein STA1M1_37520 [Sinisalibacter aestuarii]
MALHRAWAEGDTQRALEIHEVLRPAAEAMFIENSPAPVKYLLSEAGHIGPDARLPIAKPSSGARAELDRMVQTYSAHRTGLALG